MFSYISKTKIEILFLIENNIPLNLTYTVCVNHFPTPGISIFVSTLSISSSQNLCKANFPIP